MYIAYDSEESNRLLNNPLFLQRVNSKIIYNIKHDVPIYATPSSTGKVLYIDRDLKRWFIYQGKRYDIFSFIKYFEIAKKALIELFQLPLPIAKQLACYFEHKKVTNAGLLWAKYSDFLTPQIKNVDSIRLRNIPPDIDLSLFSDQQTKVLQKRMAQFSNKKNDKKDRLKLLNMYTSTLDKSKKQEYYKALQSNDKKTIRKLLKGKK
jgi:hypothetical protein